MLSIVKHQLKLSKSSALCWYFISVHYPVGPPCWTSPSGFTRTVLLCFQLRTFTDIICAMNVQSLTKGLVLCVTFRPFRKHSKVLGWSSVYLVNGVKTKTNHISLLLLNVGCDPFNYVAHYRFSTHRAPSKRRNSLIWCYEKENHKCLDLIWW